MNTREITLPISFNAVIDLTVEETGDYKMVLESGEFSSEFLSTKDYIVETPFGMPENLWNDIQGKIVEFQTELKYNAIKTEKEHWV